MSDNEMRAKIPNETAPLESFEQINDSLQQLQRQNWNGDGEFRYGTKDDPADVQYDNTRRAGFALDAVVAYQRHGVDDESTISDLLCDLRHLCDALGLEFAAELARGEHHYEAEIRGEL